MATSQLYFILFNTLSFSSEYKPGVRANLITSSLKIKSFPFSSQPVLLEPAAQVSFRRAIALGNESLRGAIRHQRLDFRSILVQFAFTSAFWPAQLLARLFASCQCLPGALTDEIALNLCRHCKGHRHDFRLNRFIQLPFALLVSLRPHTAPVSDPTRGFLPPVPAIAAETHLGRSSESRGP